jgi:hypothetical protein
MRRKGDDDIGDEEEMVRSRRSEADEDTIREKHCRISTKWSFLITLICLVAVGSLIAIVVLAVDRTTNVCPNMCNNLSIHLPNCTCYSGRYIRDRREYGTKTQPMCPEGRDYYAMSCLKSCPGGYKRLNLCSCVADDGKLLVECDKYSNPRGWGEEDGPYCDAESERYGRACYKNKCPTHRIGPDECLQDFED